VGTGPSDGHTLTGLPGTGHAYAEGPVESVDLLPFARRRSCIRGAMASADDFDFWLGTWNVRWRPTDRETGRNVVTRSFGGHVVEEQFDGRPGSISSA
jgi:hypothetical protein